MHQPPEPGEYARLSYPLLPPQELTPSWRDYVVFVIQTFGPFVAVPFWLTAIVWALGALPFTSPTRAATTAAPGVPLVYIAFLAFLFCGGLILGMRLGWHGRLWEHSAAILPMRPRRPKWWFFVAPVLRRGAGSSPCWASSVGR